MIEHKTSSAPVESVRLRYLVTVFTQFIQFAASVAIAGLVPRALGPAVFGNYNFLLTTASTLRGFLEPSAEQAFFTFSSQDRRTGPLTKFYAVILLVQVLIIFAFIGIAALLGKMDWLWAGQALDQILLVTLLEWLMFIAASLRQLGDSKGLTVHSQAVTLITSLLNVLALFGLFAFGLLNLYTYVVLNMLSAILIGMVLIHWLLIVNADMTWTGKFRERAGEYVNRWWRFAAPLLVLEYYSPLVAYLSTYLLQRWYGSIQQGYFALAFKWSALVLVFTSSALSIFWREIAHAAANGDRERSAQTYLRFSRMLFFLTLTLCVWLSFSSEFLVRLLVGDAYLEAVPVLMVMAFYPLAQTYGQINVVALKAVERTRQVRNLGILFSIPDVLLSYFLLASPAAPIPGLALGAMGVALRMVVYSLLNLQVYEWVSHRAFGLSFSDTLKSKLWVVLVVAACAVLAIPLLGAFLESLGMPPLFGFGITSSVFFISVGACCLFQPWLMGMGRTELVDHLNKGISFGLNLVRRDKK